MMDEDPMYDFLRSRDVSEDTIEKMKAEKITHVASKLGPENPDLAAVLCLGDRIALQEFCNRKDTNKDQRKKKCYDNIRKQLKLADYESESVDDDCHTSKQSHHTSSKSSKLSGNRNASKVSRIIEFGWYHNGTNVRRPNGGGTRKIEVKKTHTADGLMQEGKGLFFPGGSSRTGLEADKCELSVRDFTHKELEPEMTVGGICDSVKMSGRLRFFLYSVGPPLNRPDALFIGDMSTTLPDLTDWESSGNTTGTPDMHQEVGASARATAPFSIQTPPATIQTGVLAAVPSPDALTCWLMSEDVDQSVDDDIQFGPGTMEEGSLSETIPFQFGPLHNSTVLELRGVVEVNNTITDIADGVSGDSLNTGSNSNDLEPRSPTPPPSEMFAVLPENVRESASATVRVHRARLECEMITAFTDPSIMDQNISFKFVDEMGVDQEGLSRDAYISFWAAFMRSSAKGENERMPAITPELQDEEWRSIGRIVVKGYLEHGVFPIQLSKAFVIAMLFGEDELSPDILMSSFLKYISQPDQVLVQKAIDGNMSNEEDEEYDDFLDFISRMECHNLPSDDQVKPMLLQVAKTELIQQSKYAMDCMASVARELLVTKLPSVQSIIDEYASKMPDCRKVLKLIEASPVDADENRVLGYIKQLVRGFSPDTLAAFMQFVTGAQVVCVKNITIAFNKTRGLQRIPIARTCGPVLELSTTYASFPEFRQEFLNVLAGHSGKFDIG